MQPLRVAFVHHRDVRDIRTWSGIPFFLKEAIRRQIGPVVDLSPAPLNLSALHLVRGIVKVTTGKSWSYDHDPVLARYYGGYFTRRVAEERPDIIVSPAASVCLAYLETDIPIVYYSDATWRVIHGYYPAMSNTVRRTALGGEVLERRTLERAALALFSSGWAATSAVRDYGTDPRKVHTVYIGANLSRPPSRDEVLPRRAGKPVRLLLAGVRWEGKGAGIAYDALRRLLAMGYDAELTVVGCTPPRGTTHPRLRVVPFLNKQVPEERAQLERFWREADLFLLPTRFEAAGAVFCEAGAYALPIIATRTGGVPSLVVDGTNGYTLPPEARGDCYADVIADLIDDPTRYARLCEGSRNEFERRLNWDAWSMRVAQLIEETIPSLQGRTLYSIRRLAGGESCIGPTVASDGSWIESVER